ncbi:MAG TPA: endonuclease/exonuclease/phosphatase family protein [Kofleriaceae bacterium]|nr:endonuclease/exonuclease/phosphatase family protein [Kofleriaceae bacterium]
MTLRLVTYNVEASARNPEPTLDVIAEAAADVVLLQETTPAWERELRARFAATYAHVAFHHHHRGPGGLAVLSRAPIVVHELLPPPLLYPAQRLVLATALGELQLLNVHLRPANDGGDWVRGWFTTPPLHRREMEAFHPRLDPAYSTIVAGDFNENALTGQAIAHLVAHGYTRVATGPTWSYRGRHDGRDVDLEIDLDHVMLDPGLVAHDAHVLRAGASDHWPVVVTIDQRR